MVTRFKLLFYFKRLLFGSVKLTKNADTDKNKYSGYGIGFDSHSAFSLPDGSTGKNFIIFGVDDMNSSVHIDNKGKDNLILGGGPTQGLDNTKYPINFTQSNRKFCLSLLKEQQFYIC